MIYLGCIIAYGLGKDGRCGFRSIWEFQGYLRWIFNK